MKYRVLCKRFLTVILILSITLPSTMLQAEVKIPSQVMDEKEVLASETLQVDQVEASNVTEENPVPDEKTVSDENGVNNENTVTEGDTTSDNDKITNEKAESDEEVKSEEVKEALEDVNQAEVKEYEIIVKVKSTEDLFDSKSLVETNEDSVITYANTIKQNGKYYLVNVKSKNTLDEVMNYIRQNSIVAYVEENKQISVSATVSTNDEYISQQWALENIGLTSDTADMINNLSTNKKVIVAVIDTGVDMTHKDLAGRILPGRNVISINPTGITYSPDDAMDDYGHGTMVSGIIVANSNNNIGITGATLNSNVMILPIKALNNSGQGSSFDIADGIEYAANHNADIINMSLGDTEYSAILQDAVKYAEDKGVLVIASAGNESSSVDDFYPASFPGVIAVGAIDSKNTVASFSNQGQSLDIVAPGLSVISTTSKINRITGSDLGDETKGYYSVQNGTSFSAPYVSAAAALYKLKYPEVSAGELQDKLLSSARDLRTVGFDTATGYGKLDVSALLSDNTQSNDKIKFLEPTSNQYLSKNIDIRTQVIADLDRVSCVKFYFNQIQDSNLITTVLNSGNSDIYEGTGDISKYENGTYQLIAVAYDQDGKAITSSDLQVKVVKDNTTGLLLTVKNPKGELAANAKVIAYQKIKTYYKDTNKEEESYDLVWQGKSTSDGIVRISNTEIADLSELYVVVQGNFDYKDSMNGKAFFMYNRIVSTPGSYEIIGDQTEAVTLTAKGSDGKSLKNVKYYLAAVNDKNEIAGATSELNDIGYTAPTVFIDHGNYNIFAYSEEEDGSTYLLSKWNEKITNDLNNLNFNKSDVGEVKLDLSSDTKVNDGVIYLYNDTTRACLGIKNQQVYGKKLFVGSGSYHYKVQAQVKDSSDSWIYEFDGGDNDLKIEQGKVNLISVGKSLSLNDFIVDRDRQEAYLKGQNIAYNKNDIKETKDNSGVSSFTVPTKYKNIYLTEKFTDAYQNKLTKITKGTLNTSAVQEYALATGTSLNPFLKITDPKGNVLYNKAFEVFYDNSFWYLGNSSILGSHSVELTLESNPLAPDGLSAKMIHNLYAKKMHILKLKVKGVGVVQPFVWIYSLNENKEKLQWNQIYSLWSSGLTATFGEIRLDDSLDTSNKKNGNMLVLYYFTDKAKTKPAIITRNFTDIKELEGNDGIIEVDPDNFVWTVIDPADSNNQKMECVRSYRNLVLPVVTDEEKTVYLDHPLTQTYFNGCYLEPGKYYFSGEFTSLIRGGVYSNYYLLSDKTAISKANNTNGMNHVKLSSQNTQKVQLSVDHTKYYDYRGSSISYFSEFNNIHSNLVLQGNNYYTMGDEFYFPSSYNIKDLKFVLALGDKEDSNKIWNYVIDKSNIKEIAKDQTITMGGNISAKVLLSKTSLTSKDQLSGQSFVTDAYGNNVTSIYINSNANWLTKGIAQSEVNTEEYGVASEGTVSVTYMVPTIEIYNKETDKLVSRAKDMSFMKNFNSSLSSFTSGNYELHYKLPTGPNGVIESVVSFSVNNANTDNDSHHNNDSGNHEDKNSNNNNPDNSSDNSNVTMKYTITFNHNNGDKKEVVKVEDGRYIKAPKKPVKTGYTFTGWYKGDKKYNFNTPVRSNVILKAKWKANTYQVIFNASGGRTLVSSKKVTYNGTYKSLPVPQRVGYEFKGWYTKEKGGNKVTSKSKVHITKNQTLYAHWIKKK